MARISNNSAGSQLTQRDAAHAAKTFTSEPGYTKTPYSGFLFHVNVVFNDVGLYNVDKKTISLLIKASDLPEVQFETETYNQYNRKRIVNKRVIYQPIKLTFHDDIANNVRNMWINYNQYYNADSSHLENAAWKYDNVYRNDNFNRAYGLDTNAEVPFLDKIEIYSMGDHKYSSMTLVNPVINSAAFDDHNYSEGGKTMETIFTVEYENIIYSIGDTDNIPNFGRNNPQNYDLNTSPLGGDRFDFLQSLLNTPINIADLLGNFLKQQVGLDTQAGRVSGVSNSSGSSYVNYQQSISGNNNINSGNGIYFPEAGDFNEAQVSSPTRGLIQASTNVISNGTNISTNLGVEYSASTPNSQLPENQSESQPPVKMSNNGICWVKDDEDNNSHYDRTLYYTSYDSLEACLAAGGRESNSG